MLYTRGFIIAFLLLASFTSSAQIPFDSTLLVNQQKKLGSLYIELMENATKIKVIEGGKDTIRRGVVDAPGKTLRGEATFIYEVSDEGNLINVYMTEFWCFSKHGEEIRVLDYIVFVDEDNLGFDHNRIKQHRLKDHSERVIDYLFDYVKKNKQFKVVEPRERNLKYQRVGFE